MSFPSKVVKIAPQPGPQTAFLASTADVTIYGGSAGSGKSYALTLEPLRHVNNPQFRCVIFRRERTDIKKQGGSWDTAMSLYPQFGGKPNLSELSWTFPSGAVIQFAGLKLESDVLGYQSSQIPVIEFDELTHFTEQQFWYMWSRNRGDAGIKSYMRGTCNPDPNSWLKALLAPWVDSQYEGPRLEGGELRWLKREGDVLLDVPPGTPGSFSLTFIPAKLDDNPALLAKNPGYRTALENLPLADRMALLDGSWDALASGNMFRPDWWHYYEQEPEGLVKIRAWDMASTAPSKSNSDPDFMVGAKIGLDPKTRDVYILDIYRERNTPSKAQFAVMNCANDDGPEVSIVLEQEPGSASKIWLDNLAKELIGFDVRSVRASGTKEVRAKPLSSYVERGRVLVRKGARWLPTLIAELSAFPDPKVHDDQVDALSLGFSQLRPWGSGNISKGFVRRAGGWM